MISSTYDLLILPALRRDFFGGPDQIRPVTYPHLVRPLARIQQRDKGPLYLEISISVPLLRIFSVRTSR
jgi:hypothetical protein